MDQAADFGLRDYQLYLLNVLRDSPEDLVDAALAQLDSNQAEADQTWHRMQDLKVIVDSETGKVMPVLQRLTQILGTPTEETSGEIHGQQCIIRSFALPVWPAFRLFIAGIPEGVLYDERFVRAPGQATPLLTTPEDLQPWKVTKDEVEAVFGPLEEGDIWPPFEEYGFEHTDAGGTRSKVHAIFKFGLLERVQITKI